MQMRTLTYGLLCAAIAAAFVQPSIGAEGKKQTETTTLKDAKPSATLEVASEQMRLIMGGTKGKGVLHFNGQDYPFHFKTASAGLGAKAVKSMSATGNVYFLTKIEDFGGQYSAVAQTAIAGTQSVTATYKNDKGVTIALQGTVKGVGLGVGGGTAVIELVK